MPGHVPNGSHSGASSTMAGQLGRLVRRRRQRTPAVPSGAGFTKRRAAQRAQSHGPGQGIGPDARHCGREEDSGGTPPPQPRRLLQRGTPLGSLLTPYHEGSLRSPGRAPCLDAPAWEPTDRGRPRSPPTVARRSGTRSLLPVDLVAVCTAAPPLCRSPVRGAGAGARARPALPWRGGARRADGTHTAPSTAGSR
jgi:hypothetical protein